MRIRFAAATLLVLLPGSALAGIDRAGTTAANFLSIGADACAVGMGGATLGIGSGLSAASWNPAALGRLDQTELLFAHAGLAEQSSQEWASMGGRMGPANLRWAVTGLFQGDGSFQGRDASNNPIGNFDVSSSAFGVQVARPVGPFASVGLGAKFASEKLGSVSGSGVTFDAGLSAHSGMLGFGLAAQNVGGSMKYDAASYPFPTNIGVGVSFTHPITGLRVALDANFPSAYYNDVRGGIEWRWNDHFALRTGYRAELGAGPNEPMSGQTFGMGTGVAGMWFDYGYLVSGNGGGQHRIGLAFHPSALGLGVGGSGTRAEAGEAPASAAPKLARSSAVQAPKPEVPPASEPKSMSVPPPSPPKSVMEPAKSAVEPAKPAPAPPQPAAGIAKPRTEVVSGPPAPVSAAPVVKAATAPAIVPAPPKPIVPAPSAANAPAIVPAPPKPVAPAPPKPVAPAAKAASAPAMGPALPKPVAPATPRPAATLFAPKLPISPPPATVSHVTPAPTAATEQSAPAPANVTIAPKPAPEIVAPMPAPPAPVEALIAPVETKAEVPAAPVKLEPTAEATPAPVAAPATVAAQAPVAAPVPAPAAKPVARPDHVTVGHGETLESIAKRWGTSAPAIMMENNLVKYEVKRGQVLKLPKPPKR